MEQPSDNDPPPPPPQPGGTAALADETVNLSKASQLLLRLWKHRWRQQKLLRQQRQQQQSPPPPLLLLFRGKKRGNVGEPLRPPANVVRGEWFFGGGKRRKNGVCVCVVVGSEDGDGGAKSVFFLPDCTERGGRDCRFVLS